MNRIASQILSAALPLTAAAALLAGCATVAHEGFSKADADQSNALDFHEFATSAHERSLNTLDLNGDNYISAEEWHAAHPTPGEADEHFNHIDKDSDGRIERSEALLYLKEHVGFGKLYKDSDYSGDGMLQIEEYRDAEPAYLQLHLLSFKV
ncbi:MAG: EF-hand domain-containing protein [Verrucomicrobiales bacterium]